ncbi:MAG TPA: CcmD family protein [Actinomycetota bacterium]|nr:CcmD family protein [Actinomycetota bacterium]
MSDTSWLFIAFTAMWIGIGAYLVSLAARQRRLEARLEQLTGSQSAREE